MEDFQHILQAALGGQPVGVFWDGEARHNIVLRYPTAARDDVEKIRKLQVPVQGGVTVPIETLAHVSVGGGRAAINRENGHRYVGIRMNVRGRDLGSFVEEARARVGKDVPMPSGVTVEWGGEFESKERAMTRLELVVPVALLITLILLFNAFGAVQPGGARAVERPLRTDRRRCRPRVDGHAAVGLGGGGVHRIDRSGLAQRRAGAVGDHRAAQDRRPARHRHH